MNVLVYSRVVVKIKKKHQMSLTIAFYAAEPQALVTLFAQLLAIASSEDRTDEEDLLFAQLETYPKAAFPGRLLLPDDLDRLCSLFKNHRPALPSHFQTICTKELWNDGSDTESLTLISEQFVSEIASLQEREVQRVAHDWAATFPLQPPFEQTLPYQSVVQLQAISRHALENHIPLLFYLAGALGFFEYLRTL
jgi:hypothetical protein